jgi:hypothetical protein
VKDREARDAYRRRIDSDDDERQARRERRGALPSCLFALGVPIGIRAGGRFDELHPSRR